MRHGEVVAKVHLEEKDVWISYWTVNRPSRSLTNKAEQIGVVNLGKRFLVSQTFALCWVVFRDKLKHLAESGILIESRCDDPKLDGHIMSVHYFTQEVLEANMNNPSSMSVSFTKSPVDFT